MNKVYAFSDIHGMYGLWKQISEYCDETDKLYFLGDAADRGPDGLKIITELLNDKRVIYLKGNHEDMFVNAGLDLLAGRSGSTLLWYSNGGTETASALSKLAFMTEDVARDYISKVDKLPETAEYVNKKGKTIFLSHAGTVIVEKQKYNMWGHGGIDYLWDRDHLTWDTAEEMTDDMPIIVHGHTPVAALLNFGIVPKNYYEIHKYCGNHKIDIDLGCFLTKKIALLDLDTLEPIYFTEE